ncbi:pentatricopeptide repeat-containing protein At4g02750-like [Selaginella moellendorffii]|uniref:pentatricopeptide repeat-containing protein At4g02750-like n=1 Tax=Selaginella moellendorffii TaxID=88036 RepID=UPI000D1C8049|nr:pentatricopeptide repeat-containing protein At4g02750-like [Selaginella moellendorffii]|eukprot:XP_024536946.1 pentatricopeptide repeat-containing protein At4g02750-like [Selaginella moellendorffii]
MPEWNLVSWNVMLAAHTQSFHSLEAKSLFKSMPVVDLVSWNVILNGSSLEEARQVFEVMPERNIVSWNTLLSSFAQHGHLEEAKQIFSAMPEHDLKAWNSILSGSANFENFREILRLFGAMPARDLISWTVLLAANFQNGFVDRATKILERMEQRDLVAWSVMLAGLAHSGYFHRAIETFHSIKTTSTPDETCFVLALLACGHAGRVYDGVRCFVSMSLDFKTRPSKHHYTCVVDMLGRAGHLEDAHDLVSTTAILSSERGPLKLSLSWARAMELATFFLQISSQRT